MNDLVTTAEVAERLGLAEQRTVHNWRQRYDDFPQPLKELPNVTIWDWSDVERWAKDTGRLKG